jgi:hypothetical protein
MAKGLKAPKFGGKPKAFSRPPNKKANEEYGMAPRKKVSDATRDLDKSMGNREFGFIQNTPKKATGAMMGRPMPKIGKSSKSSTRKDGRKQFAPKAGRKVF